MTCNNCGDPATKFKPHDTLMPPALVIYDDFDARGEPVCDDCYDWLITLDTPEPEP